MIHIYVWLLCLVVHADICWAISQAACLGLKNRSTQHLLKVAGSNVAPFIQFGATNIERVEYIRRGFPINNKGHSETCWSIPATPLPHNVCRVVIVSTELWIPDESKGPTTIVGNTAFGGCIDYPGMIDGVSLGHVVVGLHATHFDGPIYQDLDWTRQPACWIMILILLFSAYVVYLKLWNILCEGKLRDQWAHHQAMHNPDQSGREKRKEGGKTPHAPEGL